MKILLTAYACEPNEVSEAGVGWNWVLQIAKSNQVWLITRENHKTSIEEALSSLKSNNIHVTYFDLPYWMRFWKVGGRFAMAYHYIWHFGAYLLAKKIHVVEKVDIAHHLSFSVTWQPCWLAMLNIPVVWGPLDGLDSIPFRFLKKMPLRNIISETLRSFIVHFGESLDPFVLVTSKRVNHFIMRSKSAQLRLPKRMGGNSSIILESAIHIENNFSKSIHKKIGAIEIGFVGRLVARKCVDYALLALSELNKAGIYFHFTIIGTGSEERRLINLANSLGLNKYVTFLGKVEHAEVLPFYKKFDIFLYPSLRDGGANVLHEAMKHHVPIVCVDYAGPGDMIEENTGYKIKLSDPDTLVKDLVMSLNDLINNPKQARKKSKNAYQKLINEYQWKNKENLINDIYFKVVNN